MYLHLQSPVSFYFCASRHCGYMIDARFVRTVPTAFELVEDCQLTPA